MRCFWLPDCSCWLHFDATSEECVDSAKFPALQLQITVSSEMIFCTFPVTRMCEMGSYFSSHGLERHLRASKWACEWIKHVSSSQTHTTKRTLTHGPDHQCQAPSLFNQNHSLQWLNYWASVCSHNPSLKGSTRVFWKPAQQLWNARSLTLCFLCYFCLFSCNLMNATGDFKLTKCYMFDCWFAKKKKNWGREELCVSILLSSRHPLGSEQQTVRKTETPIHDADGQADRQMDWGKDMQIFTGQTRPWPSLSDRLCSTALPVGQRAAGLTNQVAPCSSWLPLLPGCHCPLPTLTYHTLTHSAFTHTLRSTHKYTPCSLRRRPSLQEPGDSSRDQTGGGSWAGTRASAHCQGLGASWLSVNRRTCSMRSTVHTWW